MADAPPPAGPPQDTGAPLVLELALDPAEQPRLARLSGAKARGRASPCGIIWHDTASGALAEAGLALAHWRTGRHASWRLERVLPQADEIWPAGTPAPRLAEAADLDGLGADLPPDLHATAAFDGRLHVLDAGGVTLAVLSGHARAVADARPLCRVTLSGPAAEVAELAHALAQAVHLSVPVATLAADALALARPPLPPRHVGPPVLPARLPVGDAFAFLLVHLADVLLYHAPRATGALGPEPVHQMRVAIRRLRSAISLFGRAVRGPEIEAAKQSLRDLNRVLAPARDWDVFTAGGARQVAAALPGDRAIRALATAAEKRRLAAYAALREMLDGPAFRRLGITLAVLATSRPWAPRAATAGDDLRAFASRVLRRRMKHLLAPGAEIADLPAEDLHAIRLHAKRMRYACEFFAPIFPGRLARRTIRRLSTLQECLGHLNDTSVAAQLLADLGAERGFAAGVVRGWVAAGASGVRPHIGDAWRDVRRLDAFWD